ncbi:serine/threonine-protein kinase pakF-like [Diabrotica virgifera virgifera]|uniref:Protein kinase domain-containing protein n=1 Tax=Diabrotica virgifera virgifera TaxID=50390 RepID=A0ABM5K2D5_DIAVI|nr:serine/threonine-protein kinase pakF-like [Diabrotica virgifera virgifera]
MSWLEYPEKLFASNEKNQQHSNATENIQTSVVLANALKSDDKNNSGTDHGTILKKRKPGKIENEDTNNSGAINGSVLSAKDPTNQLESKGNTSSKGKPKNAKKQKKRKKNSQTMSTSVSCVKDPTNPLESKENSLSGGKPEEVNLAADNSIILKKEQSNIKVNAEKNNSGTIIKGSFGFVKDLMNALEPNKNTSSDSKHKEVNLSTGKTSKKEKKGKNSSQRMNTSVSCVRDPTNPLESKENISSGSKPEEVNLPTGNNSILKEEKTDNINSQTINRLKISKKPIEDLDLSWVNNPKKLFETEEGDSCSNIKTKSNAKNEKTSLPKNTSHKAAKNNLLNLDIVEQVIKKIKSNKEFKSLLEIVLNIISNKNVGNRKINIDLFELFLENYKYANPNYMKKVKTTLTYCELHIPIAPYFVDENDVEIYWDTDINYFGETKIMKGVISKNNVKRGAVVKVNPWNYKYIQNEAAVLAHLKHTNIIELLGYDPKNKVIMLDYLKFAELAEGLNEKLVDLSIKNVKKILIDLTTGMDYVHSKKILHRDLQRMPFLYNDKNEYKIGGFRKAVYVGNSNEESHSSVSVPFCEFAPEWRETYTYTTETYNEPETYTYTYKTDVWAMGSCFKVILDKRMETLCEDDITKRLQLFVTDFMLAVHPGSRKHFTEVKAFIQNMEV